MAKILRKGSKFRKNCQNIEKMAKILKNSQNFEKNDQNVDKKLPSNCPSNFPVIELSSTCCCPGLDNCPPRTTYPNQTITTTSPRTDDVPFRFDDAVAYAAVFYGEGGGGTTTTAAAAERRRRATRDFTVFSQVS